MPDCPKEVLAKFVQDEDGLWYNIRMEEEQIKRRKFVQSRRNNLSGKSSAKKKREEIEGRLEQMRSLAQANMRDREDTLWQDE
jgi:uncharacterized protein YdaU (DUF1376 family)